MSLKSNTNYPVVKKQLRQPMKIKAILKQPNTARIALRHVDLGCDQGRVKYIREAVGSVYFCSPLTARKTPIDCSIALCFLMDIILYIF